MDHRLARPLRCPSHLASLFLFVTDDERQLSNPKKQDSHDDDDNDHGMTTHILFLLSFIDCFHLSYEQVDDKEERGKEWKEERDVHEKGNPRSNGWCFFFCQLHEHTDGGFCMVSRC